MSRTPKLIVTVDAEEEGLWSGQFKREGGTVENIRGTRRFQDFCDARDIKPTYFVDNPVVQDDQALEMLRAMSDEGVCEIGAHLHPWCTEPMTEEISDRNSFLCNLPEKLQREKIEYITATIEQRFGRRPTSFRAGRFGLDIVGARILQEFGYVVDSSVISSTDLSDQGGPNFFTFPHIPYRVGGNDFCANDPQGQLLEVPVSAGYNRINFTRARKIQRLAGFRLFRPFHFVGILDRLNIVRRIVFNPEKGNASRMKQLVDTYMAHGWPCMVMYLHSSSLVPGYSPYVPDGQRLDELYETLHEVFDYCLNRYGMISEMISDFARSYMAVSDKVTSN